MLSKSTSSTCISLFATFDPDNFEKQHALQFYQHFMTKSPGASGHFWIESVVMPMPLWGQRRQFSVGR
jgi:hypothetical protein